MPIAVIGLACFLIFVATLAIGLAAVHFERRQQVREEAAGKQQEDNVQVKAV
jgi:hypothetical protein